MPRMRSISAVSTSDTATSGATKQSRNVSTKLTTNLTRFGSSSCCDYKKVLISKNSFINDIQITPRCIIVNHHKKDLGYQHVVDISNHSIIPREFSVFTDFEDNPDFTFTVLGSLNLLTGESFSVEVFHAPQKKAVQNMRLNIYIQAFHPCITLEIPIIINPKDFDVAAPKKLMIRNCVQYVIQFYGMILYNPTPNPIWFKVTRTLHEFNVISDMVNILPKSIGFLVFKGRPEPTPEKIHIKFGDVFIAHIKCNVDLLPYRPYFNMDVVKFPKTNLGDDEKSYIRVCNELPDPLYISWNEEFAEKYSKGNKKEKNISNIHPLFQVSPVFETIAVDSNALFKFIFSPILTPDIPDQYFDGTPPYEEVVDVSCMFRYYDMEYTKTISLQGLILPPSIEFLTHEVHLNQIYIGEKQCFTVQVKNVGIIPGKVRLQGITTKGYLTIKSKEFSVNPDESEEIYIQYFGKVTGKFVDTLTFRIGYGPNVEVYIKGDCVPVEVQLCPIKLFFLDAPLCVTQKKFVLIANPLSVPIIVHSKIENDGTVGPLALNPNHNLIPLQIDLIPHEDEEKPTEEQKTPESDETSSLLGTMEEDVMEEENDDEHAFWDNDDIEIESTNNLARPSVLVSFVTDIEEVTKDFLKFVREEKIQTKSEADVKLLTKAMEMLLDKPYFKELRDNQMYLNLDWETLPENSKEVIINEEPIYLKPYESTVFPVLIVPNTVGAIKKHVAFITCTVGTKEEAHVTTTIDAEYFTRRLEINYFGIYPQLLIPGCLYLGDIYVDMVNPFKIDVRNDTRIVGFIYLKDIPEDDVSSIAIYSDRKLVIQANAELTLKFGITFYQVGKMKSKAFIYVVGRKNPIEVIIAANVIPPVLRFSHQKLSINDKVLHKRFEFMSIENLTPTKAKFSIVVKPDTNIDMYPLGGILSPYQIVAFDFYTFFADTGTYKANIEIYMNHYTEPLVVPTFFRIEGVPIIFNPSLRKNLDLGPVLFKKTPLKIPVRVKNLGLKTYNIKFTKINPTRFECELNKIPFFGLHNAPMILKPGEEKLITFQIENYKQQEYKDEYVIDGSTETNRKIHIFKFFIRVHFFKPEIKWTKDFIEFHVSRKEIHAKEVVGLRNNTLLGTTAKLTVEGRYLILDTENNTVVKKISLVIPPSSTKLVSIMVLFEECAIKYDTKQDEVYDGKIHCVANGKDKQMSLLLRTKVIFPSIVSKMDKYIFFMPNVPLTDHIVIENETDMESYYEINKLDEIEFVHNQNLQMNPVKSNRVYDHIFNTDYVEDFLKKAEAIQEASDFKYPDSDTDSESEFSSRVEITSEPNLIHPQTSQKSVVSSNEQGQGDGASSKSKSKTYEEFSKIIDEFLAKDGDYDPMKTESEHWPPFIQDPKQCQCCIKGVYLDQPKGSLNRYETRSINIFFPLPKRGMSIKAKYELKTVGGRTINFEVLIINNVNAVKTSVSEVNMGKQPWYRIQKRQIEVINQDTMSCNIRLFDSSTNDLENLKKINGYLKLVTPKEFQLHGKQKMPIDFTVRLGVNSYFETDFGLDVNKSNPLMVKVYGDSCIPWIYFENVERKRRTGLYYIWVAETLNNFYLKKLRFIEPKFEEPDEDDFIRLKSSLDLMQRESVTKKSSKKSRSTSIKSRDTVIPEPGPILNWKIYNFKFFCEAKSNVQYLASVIEKTDPDVADYVVLDYPSNYPSAIDIHTMVELGIFSFNLQYSENIKMRFQYMLKNLNVEIKKLKSLLSHKVTIVRPLPHMTTAYLLDFGKLVIGESKQFYLSFFALCHERLLLSARTLLNIPGFTVRFLVPDDSPPSRFSIFFNGKDPEKCGKYRNVKDRKTYSLECMLCRRLTDLNDANCNICELKLCHAHSYDFDLKHVHQRDIKKSKKAIWDYYSKLIQGYKEHRDPNILSEIFENDLNASGKVLPDEKFPMVIEFTPTDQFYEDGYHFDDILLIDVHLGPTIPILMKGELVQFDD